jgi:hypothetical protein
MLENAVKKPEDTNFLTPISSKSTLPKRYMKYTIFSDMAYFMYRIKNIVKKYHHHVHYRTEYHQKNTIKMNIDKTEIAKMGSG